VKKGGSYSGVAEEREEKVRQEKAERKSMFSKKKGE